MEEAEAEKGDMDAASNPPIDEGISQDESLPSRFKEQIVDNLSEEAMRELEQELMEEEEGLEEDLNVHMVGQ